VVQAESAISRTATARCGCLIANFMLRLKNAGEKRSRWRFATGSSPYARCESSGGRALVTQPSREQQGLGKDLDG
jgi:hypothetical protein